MSPLGPLSIVNRVSGIVYLVGAGPGDPGLLTRRGADLLARADVVVFDGLVNAALLDLCADGCERMYAGKKHSELGPRMSQDQITALLVEKGQAGHTVVRLKGGDPFVFGRAAEEAAALADAGVAFEIVPGVSSATAVPAYAGIPLTARGVASTVAFATGHESAGKPTESVDWQALARGETVVLFMARKTLGECADKLMAGGRASDTPAAAVYWGTTAAQRTVVATLGTLAEAVDRAALRPPVLVIIGDVVSAREQLSWYERRPLFGARVLIPRSLEQGRRFADALAELGAQPVFAPVVRLEPPLDPAPLAASIQAMDKYEWVVLTSANAVRRLFAAIDDAGRDARALGLAKVACVGPVTAACLAEFGVRADLVPPHGDGAAMASAIAEYAGDALRAAHVLMPRAEVGRDEAADALRDAGAAVDVVFAYRSVTADPSDPTIRHGLRALRKGQIDVASFFAPSQVRAVCELLGDAAVEQVNACGMVTAIGNTTARALEKRGIRVDLVPSRPDAAALAQAIAAHRSTPDPD